MARRRGGMSLIPRALTKDAQWAVTCLDKGGMIVGRRTGLNPRGSSAWAFVLRGVDGYEERLGKGTLPLLQEHHLVKGRAVRVDGNEEMHFIAASDEWPTSGHAGQGGTTSRGTR